VKHVAVKGHSLNGARHGIESNRTLMHQASQKRAARRMKREPEGKGRSKLSVGDDGGLEGDNRTAARESGRGLFPRDESPRSFTSMRGIFSNF